MDGDGFGTAGGARTARAYDFLLQNLTSGEYQPGEKIDVQGVARRLGVSRQPVMAAMQQLSKDDLVQIVPQVGCLAPAFSDQEWREFSMLFAACEGLIAGLAAERGTPEERGALKPLADRLLELASRRFPKADLAVEYKRRNMDFHSHIHRMARSPLLNREMRALRNRADYYMATIGQAQPLSSRLPRAIEDHDAIVAAIVNQDAGAARRLVEEHVLDQQLGGGHH